MTVSRIFVSSSFVNKTSHTYQLYRELVDDLRTAGAEVIADENIGGDDPAQSLTQVLPSCQWLVVVETPQALTSPQVQFTVNAALNLVAQQRMCGVLRVIVEPCNPQEVPPNWRTLRVFDASKDYARALARVLLTLGLDPVFVTFERTNAIPESHPKRENHPDPPIALASSTRQHRNRWLIALSVALTLVLLVTSVVLATRSFTKSSPHPSATTTSAAIAELHASATANANATVDAKLTATTRDVNATTTARANATEHANANATAIAQANATATANENATATASANATATAYASTPQGLYTLATSGNPAINDPLSSQDANNWDTYTAPNYGCAFTGGTYQAYASQPFVTECYMHASNFSNFAFQVQMKVLNGDAGGLIFGLGGANSKEYRFAVSAGISYQTYYDLFTPQDGKRLVAGFSSVIHPGLGQPNLLTVIVRGNTIYLYVNEEYLNQFTVSGGTSISGEIGLFATEGQNPTTVAFDNAKVWML